MRWLFFILLSLNIVYITWQIIQPGPDPYSNVQPLNKVPSIALLNELPQPQQADTTEATVKSTQTSAKEKDTTVASLANQTSTLKDRTKPQIATEKKSEKTPVKAPVSVVEKKSVAAEAVNFLPETSLQGERCYTLGPFRDLSKLRSLTREIKSYVQEADFRGREEKEQSLFWVYIVPEKNRKAAIQAGKRLKVNKIKDFYIIREGKKANGLSLGQFRNKNSAYSLAKKVNNLGFNAVVEPVFKKYTIYWLDYQLADGVSIPVTIFNKYIQSEKKDSISRLSRDCGA